MANNIVAIYAGRFHPFHKGHKAVYDSLVSKFGADKVFIATSGKQNDTDSPFSFKEKAAMMMLTGIPAKAISQEVSPYKPDNVLNGLPTDTAVVFAVGKKDMDENPRFTPGLKKDGTPTYYQPLDNKKVADLEGYEKHGYLIVAPTVKFTVLGQPATSASELRSRYAKLDDEKRGEFIKDLFGNYDEVIQKVMDKRLAENITEFKVSKQSPAIRVLHNIEDRKTPFKVRYKDGTVTVSPKQARFFLNKYYLAGDELKKEMERKLSIFDYAVKWFRGAKGYSPVIQTEDAEGSDKEKWLRYAKFWKYIMDIMAVEAKADIGDGFISADSIDEEPSYVTAKEMMKRAMAKQNTPWNDSIIDSDLDEYSSELNQDYEDKTDFADMKKAAIEMITTGKTQIVPYGTYPPMDKFYSENTIDEDIGNIGKNRYYGGNEGIVVKQIKRLVKIVSDVEKLNKEKPIEKDIMIKILSQLRQITNHVNDLKMKESVMKYITTKESLYQLNRDDYLDSEVLISGIGRMTLRQAINRVKEYADEISRLMKQGDPFFIKGKLDHHADILQHYSKAVLDSYKDLGAIRKKGGVRSKSIPADVGERLQMKIDDIVLKENFDVVEGKAITEEEFDRLAEKQDACYHKVKSRYKVWPSAYASGALVQCRKVGAKNWGNKSKK